MDRITKNLLAEFSKNFTIEDLPEDEQFENFAAYVTVRRHYSETAFSPTGLVLGNGGDTEIDAIAIIVNSGSV